MTFHQPRLLLGVASMDCEVMRLNSCLGGLLPEDDCRAESSSSSKTVQTDNVALWLSALALRSKIDPVDSGTVLVRMFCAKSGKGGTGGVLSKSPVLGAQLIDLL